MDGIKTDYTGKKLVALTFDDGPNTDTTPLVLDILEKYGVAASFFICGYHINEETKMVMKRQLSLGCDLENHSWSHPAMNALSLEEIIKQVRDTNDKIYKSVGVTPKFFRPPYIATSQEMFDTIELPFINGVGCEDWDDAITTEIRVERILNTVKDGDIILLHDFSGNVFTVKALDQIIPALQSQGYAFVTVKKLFELKKVNPNIKNKLWTNTNN